MSQSKIKSLSLKLLIPTALAAGLVAITISPASSNSLTLESLPYSLGNSVGGKIATSNDGRYILSSNTNQVFISDDFGANVNLAPNRTLVNDEFVGIPITAAGAISKINSVAISATGQQMAVATDRGVYHSTDFGVTWLNRLGSFGTSTWQTTVSKDGSTLYRASVNRIWRSVNGAADQLLPPPPSPLLGIKTSSNGNIYYILTEAGLYRRDVTDLNQPYRLLHAGRIADFAVGDASNENVAIILDNSFRREVYVSKNTANTPVGTTWTKLNFANNIYQKVNVVMNSTGENIAVTYNDGIEVFDLTQNATNSIASWGGFIFTPVAAAMSYSGSRVYFRTRVGTTLTIDFTPFEVQGLDSEPGDGSVTLTWNDPNPGDSPIIDYVIEYSTNRVNWTRDVRQMLTRSPAVVTGLTNGTSYYFRVAAINKYGQGSWTVDDFGAKPYGSAQQPTINSVSVGDKTVNINLSQNLNGTDFYLIEIQFFNAATNQIVMQYNQFTNSNSANSRYFSNLSNSYQITSSDFVNGTAYYFKTRVAFIPPIQPWGSRTYSDRVWPASTGFSAPSATFIPRVPPSAPGLPQNISVSSGESTLTVTWKAPASNGGRAITGYHVFLNDVQRVIVGGNNTFSATITGITNQCSADATCWGADYTVGVRAINEIGPGQIASLGPFVSVAPQTKPSAPRGVYAQAKSGAIAVQWDTPATSGGSPITGYRVFWETSGITLGADLPANTTSYVITSLNNYTNYNISVLAFNDIGDSDRANLPNSIKPIGEPKEMVQTRLASVATGGAFETQPQFTLKDDNDQTMTFDNFSTVVASISSDGMLLGTTSATAVAGVVTFDNLGIAGTAGTQYTITYSVTISDQAFQSETSYTFTVTETKTAVAGPAAKLRFKQPATGAQPGAFTQAPIIEITDIAGNLVGGQNRRITVNGPSVQFANEFATLWIDPSNTTYIDTNTDTADFTGLGFVYPASFELTFSSAGLSSISQTINPVPGDPHAIEPARNPDNTVVNVGSVELGEIFEIQPEFQITDLNGLPVSNYIGNLTITVNDGTLIGITTVPVINGKASFRNLMIVNTSDILEQNQNMIQITATAPGLLQRIVSFLVRNGSYLISFNSNGATGGSNIASINYQTLKTTEVTNTNRAALAAVATPDLTRAGFSFTGWGTLSGNALTAVDLTTFVPTGPTVLYAMWQPLATRTISIASIATKQYGTASFTPEITISTAPEVGELVLTSTSTACQIGEANRVEIIGVGNCTLTASITGETTYQLASTSTEFLVEPKPLTIIDAQIVERDFDGTTNLGALNLSVARVEGIIAGEESEVLFVLADPPQLPAADPGSYQVTLELLAIASNSGPNFNYSINPLTLTAVVRAVITPQPGGSNGGSGGGSSGAGSNGSGSTVPAQPKPEVNQPIEPKPEVKPEPESPLLATKLLQTSKLTLSLAPSAKQFSKSALRSLNNLINSLKQKHGPGMKYELKAQHSYQTKNKSIGTLKQARLRSKLIKSALVNQRGITASHQLKLTSAKQASRSLITIKVWQPVKG